MKPLDEYIRNNPERFDTDEPLNGHFDRFAERLERAGEPKFKKQLAVFLKIAAAVLLIAVISFAAFREFRFLNRNLGNIISANEYPELKEVERFYNVQLDQYYDKLQNLRFNNDKAQKQQVLDELSDMDRQVRTMKRDLMQNPDDERVVHAIINYYQVKLELMDMIITRIEESNNTIL
jgi:hypothetical protein